ncbi:hypothetical protein D7Z26_00515 [Cohnella endophytica]|uniref:Uncharacterized protein n=1 Tax=Cohnella endophytica TaxID=2419778 RepID=A0A494Y5S1_9BACL|nr:hypothetical protein [Cohnella endophytica]RKP58029.1 hypothetical protein D7Z26_00515 [Cohnella endophytica]
MSTNLLLIITVIVMAAAVIWTVRVGVSLGKKETNGSYFAHSGRKLGRLLSLYVVVIIAVIIIFIAMMNK